MPRSLKRKRGRENESGVQSARDSEIGRDRKEGEGVGAKKREAAGDGDLGKPRHVTRLFQITWHQRRALRPLDTWQVPHNQSCA